MIPIECPDCHSGLFTYMQDKSGIVKATMCIVNEDTDIQRDFTIVQVCCEDCKKTFWVGEAQAQEHVECYL